MGDATRDVTSETHVGSYRAQLIFAALGIGTAVAMWVVTAIAPCDLHAPIMSLDGSRAMPQPYAKISLLLNIASPIFVGLAAAKAVGRPWGAAALVGFVTWLVAGFTVYFVDVQVWKAVCPV